MGYKDGIKSIPTGCITQKEMNITYELCISITGKTPGLKPMLHFLRSSAFFSRKGIRKKLVRSTGIKP